MKITRFFKRAFAAVWKNLVLWGIQLRVAHWGKNFLVFFPMLYCGRGGDFGTFVRVCGLFAAFCLLSSAMYLVNDIADLSCDRLHPFKRARPLASGILSSALVPALALILTAVSLCTVFFMERGAFHILFAYLLNALAYTFFFKKTAFLDILSLETGFFLRLAAGAAVAGCRMDKSVLLCMFFLCLFLIFAKRRSELALLKDRCVNPLSTRRVFHLYGERELDAALKISAALSIFSYLFFVFKPLPARSLASFYLLLFTVPPVVYCLIEYARIIMSGEMDSIFRSVLKHTNILAASGVWALFFFLAAVWR